MEKAREALYTALDKTMLTKRFIPITGKSNGKKGVLKTFAVIDPEDYGRLIKYNWCLDNGYAFSSLLGRMHRFIMNTPEGMDTDHINHNRIDNKKSNLRVCTRSQNQFNSSIVFSKSGFKGVSFHQNKWMSRIVRNGKLIFLGYYDTPEEAAKAYDTKAVELFGEFSCTNADLGLL